MINSLNQEKWKEKKNRKTVFSKCICDSKLLHFMQIQRVVDKVVPGI